MRPFEIETDSDATFDDITIMGGNISDNGGGIFNDGTLTVTNSTLPATGPAPAAASTTAARCRGRQHAFRQLGRSGPSHATQ